MAHMKLRTSRTHSYVPRLADMSMVMCAHDTSRASRMGLKTKITDFGSKNTVFGSETLFFAIKTLLLLAKTGLLSKKCVFASKSSVSKLF